MEAAGGTIRRKGRKERRIGTAVVIDRGRGHGKEFYAAMWRDGDRKRLSIGHYPPSCASSSRHKVAASWHTCDDTGIGTRRIGETSSVRGQRDIHTRR